MAMKKKGQDYCIALCMNECYDRYASGNHSDFLLLLLCFLMIRITEGRKKWIRELLSDFFELILNFFLSKLITRLNVNA